MVENHSIHAAGEGGDLRFEGVDRRCLDDEVASCFHLVREISHSVNLGDEIRHGGVDL
jgi:hypothetical protein